MAAILQGNNNNNNFQQSLYVYIQEKHSYSGSKSREWALTHMQRKHRTHTQAEIQTHRQFYSFLIRFPRKCDECAKGFCRCRCLQHTHTQPEPAHTQTNWHAYMNVCVCVCRTATRGQPHCAIIAVVVAVAVMWACVCVCGFWCLRWSATTTAAAQLRSLASSLWRSRNVWPKFSQTHTHTHMYARKHTHSFPHTHRHRALTCCTLHVLSLACCSWMLLPLPFVVAIAFSLLCALFRCNSLKFG